MRCVGGFGDWPAESRDIPQKSGATQWRQVPPRAQLCAEYRGIVRRALAGTCGEAPPLVRGRAGVFCDFAVCASGSEPGSPATASQSGVDLQPGRRRPAALAGALRLVGPQVPVVFQQCKGRF